MLNCHEATATAGSPSPATVLPAPVFCDVFKCKIVCGLTHLHVLSADMCSSGITGGTICPLESGSSYANCPQIAANLACTATGERTTLCGFAAVTVHLLAVRRPQSR